MSTIRQRLDDRLNAFCHDTEAYLAGVANGPLAGLTFAAKDIFDVAGYVTGGGNPDWQATHAVATRTAWQAPSYDTIGWFARDADLFARVGAVLLQSGLPAACPSRLVIAEDAFEVADP